MIFNQSAMASCNEYDKNTRTASGTLNDLTSYKGDIKYIVTAPSAFFRLLRLTVNQVLWLVLILFSALPAFAASPPSEAEVTLQQNKVIFGGSKNYPPFEWLDDQKQARGFLIDLENAIGDSGKIQAVHRLMEWNIALQALESGELDSVPMFITPEREKRFLFTEPIYHMTHGIFTRQGDPPVSRPGELAGKRIAIVNGGYAHERLKAMQQGINLRLIESRDIADALQKLETAQADYAVLARHTARRLISEDDFSITQTSPPIWPQSYAFAVRDDNPALHRWIQHHLMMVQASGEYQRIYNRWDGQLEWSAPGLFEFFKQYAWLLSALLTIILLVSIWSWLLGRQVRHRTSELRNELKRRKQAESELEYLAHHDILTGLTNRHRFIHDLTRLREAEPDHEITVAAIQITGIENVTLHFGYNVSEEMLQAFAERLRSTQLDVLSHLGAGLYAIARLGSMPPGKLTDCIRETLQLEYIEIDPRITVGIVNSKLAEHDADELLRRANVALSAAIELRRPWKEYSADIEPDRRSIMLLRDYWQQGTENFHAYYQPQIDLKSNRIIGAEALVRWHHPSLGMVRPDQFIPLLEKAGMIYKLTEKMIDDAVRFGTQRRRQDEPCPVSINVAVSDLIEHDLVTIIQRALEHHGGRAEDLRVEMTETGLISEPTRVRLALKKLQNMGIRCEIDDFGTGYSSLSYLSDFPVHGIKIERMFVGRMYQDKRLRSIVNSTINLAHDLDMHVVAEGPEDTDTIDILRRYGCDYAQGYIYSAALPETAFLKFIEKWSSVPVDSQSPA